MGKAHVSNATSHSTRQLVIVCNVIRVVGKVQVSNATSHLTRRLVSVCNAIQ